jgi:predicted nucleic acid-binding protein
LEKERRLLVVDANVLIDYLSADLAILGLAARHLGTIHVPRAILDEVRQIGEKDCDRLGLHLVEASLDQLLEAGRRGGGRLSFNDRLCLILARDGGWTCVTNDGALRKACGAASVSVLWGLELMTGLAARGHLAPAAALRTARAIQAGNPRHITEDILERFERKIRESG